MRSAEESMSVLEHIKRLGLRISIAGFGAGYFSLSYLKRFPVDTLKIDRSFTRDISSNKEHADIVRAPVAPGHNFNIKALAEGVEIEDE